jgi:hypothetical protein
MIAIAALAASGYQAPNEGHHYWNIRSLLFTLQIDKNIVDVLNRFRQKRPYETEEQEPGGLAMEQPHPQILRRPEGCRSTAPPE